MTPILYLHGFASGPRSQKGLAVERHFVPRGRPVERLDLRLPSMEHLRLSAMIARVRHEVGRHERVVLMGSSLGGLCAAHVAVDNARVAALILLAPAFALAARWRGRDPAGASRWERDGWLKVVDHTTGGQVSVDFGFLQDVEAIDHDLPVLDVPTLIVHGVTDDTVGIESSRALAANPRVRLVEVDDGHELVASLPVILAEAERFLGGG